MLPPCARDCPRASPTQARLCPASSASAGLSHLLLQRACGRAVGTRSLMESAPVLRTGLWPRSEHPFPTCAPVPGSGFLTCSLGPSLGHLLGPLGSWSQGGGKTLSYSNPLPRRWLDSSGTCSLETGPSEQHWGLLPPASSTTHPSPAWSPLVPGPPCTHSQGHFVNVTTVWGWTLSSNDACESGARQGQTSRRDSPGCPQSFPNFQELQE